MIRWVFAAALAMACTVPPLPKTIAVDPSLPDGVHLGSAVAVDAWCRSYERTGWCPEIVVGTADYRIEADHWRSEVTEERGGGGAHNVRREKLVGLSSNMLEMGEIYADVWAGAISHELGHMGIDEHVEDSPLMRAYQPEWVFSATVDEPALRQWCIEQGC